MSSVFIPAREPAVEEPASRLRGVPLERLSGLAATQPYASTGPWLDPAAVALLYKVAQTHRIGRFERAGQESAVKALTDAELLNSAGQLTPGGQYVTNPLDRASAALTFSASYLGQPTELRVWMDDENALLLAGPSAGDFIREPETAAGRNGALQLKFVSIAELFPVLAAWLGISPAWSLPVSPTAFPVDVLNHRHKDFGAPLPQGANEALAYAWSEPWFLWHVLLDPATREGVGYLNAGGAGHFRVVVEEDQARLTSVASANVYRHLVDLVESVRFQRPFRFA